MCSLIIFSTCLKRISLIIFIIVCALVLIHLMPKRELIVEPAGVNCDRPCLPLEWPMICRYKFTVEVHDILSHDCDLECAINSTQCDPKNCVRGDGRPRTILTINKKLPSPPINVCKGDIMVIDVENRVSGMSMTVHWNGQKQTETPFMDGVPMITQCPIQSFTTFQYKFRAGDVGTHIYHAFSGDERNNGISGAFVVRQPIQHDPHQSLYDHDLTNHTILLSEWGAYHDRARSILINGLSTKYLSTFFVEHGQRYRFRVVYSGGQQNCQIKFSIDNHNLLIIAVDGNNIKPFKSNEIFLNLGDRVDFILVADQLKDSLNYMINATNLKESCENPVKGNAILFYNTIKRVTGTNANRDFDRDATRTNVEENNNFNQYHQNLEKYESLENLNEDLRYIDRTIYLPILHQNLSKSRYRKHYFGNDDYYQTKINENKKIKDKLISSFGNISFTFPPSPYYIKRSKNYQNLIECNGKYLPKKCERKHKFHLKYFDGSPDGGGPANGAAENICDCVYMEKISIGERVELIFLNFNARKSETFHLHGNSFYLMDIQKLSQQFSLNYLNELKKLNADENLFKLNFQGPIKKNIINIPPRSAISVRFLADNPGYWMLRDFQSKSWSRGLDLVLQVGEMQQIIMPPSNFPKCGDWVGPQYFFI